ncbi:MAG: (S)-ureidoglycine aminohydrolase [Acidobacteriia bacterium]|nr:(S)-ureidoglycine aminohydrolase [Terriglobia bacterium]
MHALGHTRSASRADHLLQTPDTFVRSKLPQISKGTAIVHVDPGRGARFLQYTAELECGGSLQPIPAQRFAYVLQGEARVGSDALAPGDYAYCPTGHPLELIATQASRIAVIEKTYEPLSGIPEPTAFVGRESNQPSDPLNGNAKLRVRSLLPVDLAFDLAVNTMEYDPGASLPMVEIHTMEHGVLMLEGGGIMRMNDFWYPTGAGDFVWMAPYCPQWFGALGEVPAKYLIYKNWNR